MLVLVNIHNVISLLVRENQSRHNIIIQKLIPRYVSTWTSPNIPSNLFCKTNK